MAKEEKALFKKKIKMEQQKSVERDTTCVIDRRRKFLKLYEQKCRLRNTLLH